MLSGAGQRRVRTSFCRARMDQQLDFAPQFLLTVAGVGQKPGTLCWVALQFRSAQLFNPPEVLRAHVGDVPSGPRLPEVEVGGTDGMVKLMPSVGRSATMRYVHLQTQDLVCRSARQGRRTRTHGRVQDFHIPECTFPMRGRSRGSRGRYRAADWSHGELCRNSQECLRHLTY